MNPILPAIVTRDSMLVDAVGHTAQNLVEHRSSVWETTDIFAFGIGMYMEVGVLGTVTDIEVATCEGTKVLIIPLPPPGGAPFLQGTLDAGDRAVVVPAGTPVLASGMYGRYDGHGPFNRASYTPHSIHVAPGVGSFRVYIWHEETRISRPSDDAGLVDPVSRWIDIHKPIGLAILNFRGIPPPPPPPPRPVPPPRTRPTAGAAMTEPLRM